MEKKLTNWQEFKSKITFLTPEEKATIEKFAQEGDDEGFEKWLRETKGE